MKGFAAVFEREIVERRLLPLAAFVLGLVPLAAPLLPGMPAAPPPVLRSGVALGLALIVSFVLAVLLGGSVIARDLGERRLGFYFARPLSGGAIWAGKLAAAAALAVGAGVLVLLPTSLLGGLPDPSGYWDTTLGPSLSRPELALGWLGALLLAVAAANAASVMLRSRSPWLLLDLAVLSVTSAVAFICLQILIRDWAGGLLWARLGRTAAPQITLLQNIEMVMGAVTLVALLAAGAAQVSRGRTDLHRGHRILSLVLWSALLPAAIVLAGYTRWFESPSPQDLVSVEGVVAAPAGSWIALYGRAAHRGAYLPGFLLDAGSGRFVRAGFGLASWGFGPEPFVRFSADGRRAFWLESDRGSTADLDLWTLDLRRPGASRQPTQVSLPRYLSSFALSADGRMVAWVKGDRLTVTEIGSGRLLASVPLPDKFRLLETLVFSGPHSLRLYGFDSFWGTKISYPHKVRLSISNVDVATGKLSSEEMLETVEGHTTWTVSPTADRGLLRAGKTLQLRDGATGKLVAILGGEGSRASFLPDGRIALLERSPQGSDLRFLDAATGAELRRFQFPAIRTVLVADQPRPDLVRVVTRGSDGSAPWQLWSLHLSTGEALPGPQLALTTLPFEGAGPWPQRRGRDGIVWFNPDSAREVVVLSAAVPIRQDVVK